MKMVKFSTRSTYDELCASCANVSLPEDVELASNAGVRETKTARSLCVPHGHTRSLRLRSRKYKEPIARLLTLMVSCEPSTTICQQVKSCGYRETHVLVAPVRHTSAPLTHSSVTRLVVRSTSVLTSPQSRKQSLS